MSALSGGSADAEAWFPGQPHPGPVHLLEEPHFLIKLTHPQKSILSHGFCDHSRLHCLFPLWPISRPVTLPLGFTPPFFWTPYYSPSATFFPEPNFLARHSSLQSPVLDQWPPSLTVTIPALHDSSPSLSCFLLLHWEIIDLRSQWVPLAPCPTPATLLLSLGPALGNRWPFSVQDQVLPWLVDSAHLHFLIPACILIIYFYLFLPPGIWICFSPPPLQKPKHC